jgi:phosphoribosyl 1,2-cyclic phosphate phosphodiesterase
MGFMSSKIAYIPDCQHIPPTVLEFLKQSNLEILIINCLQINEHQTQLTVDQSFDYINMIKAKSSYLIHMNHELSNETLLELIAEKKQLKTLIAHDGLKITW